MNAEINTTIPTVSEVWRDYRRTRKLRSTTLASYDYLINSKLADWLHFRMTDITKSLVENRHGEITRENGPKTANNSFRVLRSLFSYAMNRYDDATGAPLIKANPVNILKNNWNREKPRQTYINKEYFASWYQAVLSLKSDTARDYFLFLAFTGCRKSEGAKLCWDDISFDLKQITFKDTKNHRDHTIPVCSLVMAILARRLKKRVGRYVFPSKNDMPFASMYNYQNKVTTNFGQSWQLHDLRRSWATTAHFCGMEFISIKRLLNHTDHDITWRYIVHDPEKYRQEVERMGLYLMQLMGIHHEEIVYQLPCNSPRLLGCRRLRLIDKQRSDSEKEERSKEKRMLVTLEKAWFNYKLNSDQKPSTLETWEDSYEKAFHLWRNRQLNSVTTAQLECLHKEASKQHGPSLADFALFILGEVFDFAKREFRNAEGLPIITSNPAATLISERLNLQTEKVCQSHLQPKQIRKWFLAVESESESQAAKDYLMFLLFTGVKTAEAADLKWFGINYDDNSILLNRRTITLHPWLAERFLRRQELALGREYVFASKADRQYRLPDTIRSRIQKKCGITFDSLTVSKTFHMIASTLGFDTVNGADEYKLVQDAIFRHMNTLSPERKMLDRNSRSRSDPMFRYGDLLTNES